MPAAYNEYGIGFVLRVGASFSYMCVNFQLRLGCDAVYPSCALSRRGGLNTPYIDIDGVYNTVVTLDYLVRL